MCLRGMNYAHRRPSLHRPFDLLFVATGQCHRDKAVSNLGG